MPHPEEQDDNQSVVREETAILLSFGCLIIGCFGYFTLKSDLWLFYFFAHLGALGLLGLCGCATGELAKRRVRRYWKAFTLGFLLPIVTGILGVLVFLWGVDGQLYCGGSVSLLTAIGVLIFYLLAKQKSLPVAEQVSQ